MRKTLITAATLIAMSVMTAGAYAATTWSVFMYPGGDATGLGLGAADAAGNPIVDGTYVLIADTKATGHVGLGTPQADQWLWDPTDILLDKGPIGLLSQYNTPGECYPVGHLESYPAGLDATDDLYIVWFNTPYNPGATGPGNDTHFGSQTLLADDGVTTVGPNAGNTFTYYPAGGVADQQTPPAVVVPEPAGLTLMALAAVGLVARRRRA